MGYGVQVSEHRAVTDNLHVDVPCQRLESHALCQCIDRTGTDTRLCSQCFCISGYQVHPCIKMGSFKQAHGGMVLVFWATSSEMVAVIMEWTKPGTLASKQHMVLDLMSMTSPNTTKLGFYSRVLLLYITISFKGTHLSYWNHHLPICAARLMQKGNWRTCVRDVERDDAAGWLSKAFYPCLSITNRTLLLWGNGALHHFAALF